MQFKMDFHNTKYAIDVPIHFLWQNLHQIGD